MFLDVNGKIIVKPTIDNVEALKNYVIRQLNNFDIDTKKVEGNTIFWKGPVLGWINPLAMFRGMEGKIDLNMTSSGDLVVNYFVSLLLYRIICIMFSLGLLIVFFFGGRNFFVLIGIGIIWIFFYGITWLTTNSMFKGLIERVLS